MGTLISFGSYNDYNTNAVQFVSVVAVIIELLIKYLNSDI
jgi:hypothetical protein